jgi:hypothetical protein
MYSRAHVLNYSGKLLYINTLYQLGHAAGGAVVEALRYKPEGREIDSQLCQNFSLTLSFRPHYGRLSL